MPVKIAIVVAKDEEQACDLADTGGITCEIDMSIAQASLVQFWSFRELVKFTRTFATGRQLSSEVVI